MKTAISSVMLVLLCTQISLAIAGGNTPTIRCKADLTELRTNARKFIARLKQFLDSGHNALAGIVELDANLFKIEHYYLSDNYATDEKAARTDLKSFVDGFTKPFVKLSDFVNSVQADCDAMLKLGDDFAKENNLISRPQQGVEGCEAELGMLRGEFFDLLMELNWKRQMAVGAIKVMKSTLSNLDGRVKELALSLVARETTNIHCCDIRTAANRFFVEFNRRHWIGYKQFVELQFICDEITARVSILDVKLKCL